MAMEVTALSVEQANQELCEFLVPCSENIHLESREALAQATRRAASFICPVTKQELSRKVMEMLAPLVGTDASSKIRETLTGAYGDGLIDDLIRCGDLREVSSSARSMDKNEKLLFLGAPSFLKRDNGDCLLIGIQSEGRATCSSESLQSQIEHIGHLRWVKAKNGRSHSENLLQFNLREINADQWLKQPRKISAQDLVREYTHLLDQEPTVVNSQIDGLTLLDHTKPTRYYRGRWRDISKKDSGNYLARRPQAFSNDRWCFIKITGGNISKILDLPCRDLLARGCDESWRLQAAIDFTRNRPQTLFMEEHGSGAYLLKMGSPPPEWVQRRLDLFGDRFEEVGNNWPRWLINKNYAKEEAEFLEEMMFYKTEHTIKRSPK
jgi:hypothetical protein